MMRGGSLGVDLAHNGVPLFQRESLGVLVLARQGHVLVQVALPGRLNDGGADGGAAAALPERLVAGNQLFQLLKATRTRSGHVWSTQTMHYKPSRHMTACIGPALRPLLALSGSQKHCCPGQTQLRLPMLELSGV